MPRPGNGPLGVLLLALTVVAFAPLRYNGFVDLDDQAYITANEHVLLGLNAANFRWAWTTFHGNYWQPLSWLSLQWDAHWFSTRGLDPMPVPSAYAFHFQSLFWHCVSVLLLFSLLLRLTRATWPSFLVAALFALHPLRVESVAWAAERKDVLCVCFGLLALHAYVWYCAQPGWRRYALVAAAFSASLLCKPMLMTLPAVLLLLDAWPLRRLAAFQTCTEMEQPADQPPVAWWRLVLEKLPLLLCTAAIACVTLWARERTHAGVPFEALPLWLRLIHVPASYGWYLTHTFYPVGLGALYPHPGQAWSPVAVGCGAGLLSAVTALSVWQWRRRPWLLVGWLWFVVTLTPVIGLTQGGLQAWADRFVYWPQIGLLLAAVWTLAELVERWRVPMPVSAGVCTALIACCAVLTWQQVGTWRDTPALWQHTLAVTADNHRAHINLGKWHLEHGELVTAGLHFDAAVKLRPHYADYHYCLGLSHLLLGHSAVAAALFQTAVQLDPAHADAWHNLGMARLHEGQPGLAVPCFRKVLELAPDQTEARTELGRALWRNGERAEAVDCFRAALDSNPADPYAWEGMGLVHLTHNDPEQALRALTRAVELGPSNPYAMSELGIAYGRKRQWREAVRWQAQALEVQVGLEERLASMNGTVPEPDGVAPRILFECRCGFALQSLGEQRAAAEVYAAATRRDPAWPRKVAALAWRLATDADTRDPQQAHELAQQALQGTPGRPAPALLDALAASEAALGHYPQAVHSAHEALSEADPSTAASIREHLKHYEHGEPVTTHTH